MNARAINPVLQSANRWQCALATYMQLISWVPLGQWNYQPCCPTAIERAISGRLTLGSVVALAIFLLIPAAWICAVNLRSRLLAGAALLACAIWLGLQIATWWPPYITGASPRWTRIYERAFAESTQVLPRWGAHLPPDAMHLVLQALLGGTLVRGVQGWRHLSRVEGAE